MKLVCYIKEGQEQLAMMVNNTLYDMDALHPELPSTMSMLLNYWEDYIPLAKQINESIELGKISLTRGIPLESINVIAPVPLPASCRRAVVFSEYTSTLILDGQARDRQEYPAYNFISHHNVQGIGDVNCMPDHFEKLDLEPGIAAVVCAHGRNIMAGEAAQYIGGYMIMNSIYSQGRLKGKDIAHVLGPWLVTPDELEPYKVSTKDGHTGNSYNLNMKCSVNGQLLSEVNLEDMYYTFEEILESCAYGTDLQAGDIIGTGAVTMGCLRDFNKSVSNVNKEQWLQHGDVVELEVEGLGISTVTIAAESSDFTLLHYHNNM